MFRKTTKKYRKSSKKYRKTTKKYRKSSKKYRKTNKRGGKYNEVQQQNIRLKLQEFGFDNIEITNLLNRINKTSQLFASQPNSIPDQLDAFHRRYDMNAEEKKDAIREWVNQLDTLDTEVETDTESQGTPEFF